MVAPFSAFARRCSWAAVALLAVALALGGADAAPKLRVGVQRNAPPLSYLDKEGKLQGFTPALMGEMSKLGLFEVQLQVDYWKTNLDSLQAGRLDALADIAPTDERRVTMDFSIASAATHAVLFQREDGPSLTRTADWRGRTVGVLMGTLPAIYLDAHPELGLRVVQYDGQDKLLRAVQGRECDGGLFTNLLPPERMALVEQLKLKRVLVDDIVFTYRFAVRKGDSVSLALLNDALAALKQDGTFDRIYDEWVGPVEPRRILLSDLRPYGVPAAVLLLAVVGAFLWQRNNLARIAEHAAAIHQSQRELRRLNSELEWRVAARTNEVEGLLRSIPDVVVIWERNGTVLSCNLPRPEFRPAFLLGRGKDTMPDALLTGLAGKVTAALSVDRDSVVLEHEFLFEGATFWIEARGTRIDDRRVLLIIRDVSPRKQMEDDMRANLMRARELADLRAQFVSLATHEFGGPLAAATLSTSMLDLSWDQLSPQVRRDLLNRLTASHQQLSRIMDDLLAISRTDVPGAAPRLSAVDVRRMMQDIVGEVRAGSGSEHRFTVECAGEPAVMPSDPRLLQRIFSNLIGNAVRYSPVATMITVRLQIEDNAFSFAVSDEGIGIPVADRQRVFEPFARGSNVGDRPGTGLGLNIVKRYVELLGGTVELLPLARGTCFKVTIPRVESADAAPGQV